jgi:hypothetical protein
MCPACAATVAQLVVAAVSATVSVTALIVKAIWKTTRIAPLHEGAQPDGVRQ